VAVRPRREQRSVLVTMKDKGHRASTRRGHELSQQEFMAYAGPNSKKIKDVSRGDSSPRRAPSRRRADFPSNSRFRGRSGPSSPITPKRWSKNSRRQAFVTDLDTDYDVGMPELHVIPDRSKATERAVSVVSIGNTVNAMIGGVLVGRYARGGHRYGHPPQD